VAGEAKQKSNFLFRSCYEPNRHMSVLTSCLQTQDVEIREINSYSAQCESSNDPR